MMNSDPATSAPIASTERRQFLAAGGATLAGLMLAPAFAQGQAATPPNATAVSSLFACPMNADGTYALPPLPYAYNALEPSIDEQTMKLHHDIHFLGYMNGLNNALKQLTDARAKNEFPQVQYWENQLAFNGSGYVLHNVFFKTMCPPADSAAGLGNAALQKSLVEAFGSFDAFKAQFSAAAAAVEGSGWAILAAQPFGKKLIILQAEKHQNLTQWGVAPILALDVWEHAYYLKYQNKRADYIKAWWNVVNWTEVGARVDAAQRLSTV